MTYRTGFRFILLVCLIAAVTLAAAGRIAFASGEAVRGELNGWGSWGMSSSLGGTFIYVSGQQTAASDAASEFKFFKDSNQWYGNGSTITFAQIYGNFSSSGGNSSFSHTQNKYYVFKWNGADKGVVFQLSAAPVNIIDVTQSPSSLSAPADVAVTATTDATPPAEQTIWLRYTTNNWSSSSVVQMTGGGASYSAVIPSQPICAVVRYYVFTTANVGAVGTGDADLLTITYDTNGGSNYSYSVGNPIGDAQALWLDTNSIAWNGAAGSS